MVSAKGSRYLLVQVAQLGGPIPSIDDVMHGYPLASQEGTVCYVRAMRHLTDSTIDKPAGVGLADPS